MDELEELLFWLEPDKDLLPLDLEGPELLFTELLLLLPLFFFEENEDDFFPEDPEEDFFGVEVLVLAFGATAVSANAGTAGTEKVMVAAIARAAILRAAFHFPYGVSAMVGFGAPVPCWEWDFMG